MPRLRLGDSRKLLLIVLAGITVRIFTLWVGRPEFTGWLNHTYYYFVQVRGLLEHGALPYNDMPLLFYVYALLARILVGLGVEPNAGVVASTRLVMCVAPALIPLPVCGIIRSMNRGRELRPNQWVLIALSAFLPLSLSHQPEFLQKNVLGLLLLSCLLFHTQRLMGRFNRRDSLLAALFALLIASSHFGTFGAMVLWGLSVFLAFSIIDRDPKKILSAGCALAVAATTAIGLIHLFDPHRFERIFVYLRSSIGNSLVAELVKDGGGDGEAVASLAAILAAYVLLCLLQRLYSRRLPNAGARAFGLANVLFCGLLLLPVVDRQLMGRLALFTPIPLLIVLAHVEAYGLQRPRLKTAAVAVAAAALLLLALGELISSRIHNANHEAIFADIQKLQASRWFGPNDLVLARTGAEHVSNWFFRVKAGVITSLNLRDFADFDRIYVLNPIEGSQSLDGLETGTISNEDDRYRFMRSNILLTEPREPLFVSDNIELFRLEGPPRGWVFDERGNWTGYSGP